MLPASGASSPPISLSRVDFPTPFRPSRPTRSPRSMLSVVPSSRGGDPNPNVTPATRSTDMRPTLYAKRTKGRSPQRGAFYNKRAFLERTPMPTTKKSLKNVVAVRQAPPRHWVGDGFHVHSMFSYEDDSELFSPF